MADHATLARPYARAAFEYARDADTLVQWRMFLVRLADLIALAPVRDLITSSEVGHDERAALLEELVGTDLPAGGANLLRLMSANSRLAVLPALTGEFVHLADAAETTLEVEIETAVALEKTHSERLIVALGKRLGHRIKARFAVVPEIVGGVVIRIGDHVMDASLATRLRRLTRAMAG